MLKVKVKENNCKNKKNPLEVRKINMHMIVTLHTSN